MDNLAGLLGKRFIQRRDVKAIQRTNGEYNPVREWNKAENKPGPNLPFKMTDLLSHLSGEKTFGHYLVDPTDQVKLFAYDIDFVEEFRDAFTTGDQETRENLTIQIRCLAESLAIRIHRLIECEIAIAFSGRKGLHVYGFTGANTPAADARGAAVLVLESFGSFEPSKGENFYRHAGGRYANLEIEIFPKQNTLAGKDLGNLMRLPLGIHQKSGNPGFFVNPECGYNELRPLDPEVALDSPFYAEWARK